MESMTDRRLRRRLIGVHMSVANTSRAAVPKFLAWICGMRCVCRATLAPDFNSSAGRPEQAQASRLARTGGVFSCPARGGGGKGAADPDRPQGRRRQDLLRLSAA